MSNVVATILSVALVIALVALVTFIPISQPPSVVGFGVAFVALVTVILFNFEDEKSYKSSTEKVELTTTDSRIQATVLESRNVQEYVIDEPDSEPQLSAKTINTIEANDQTGEYPELSQQKQ